jgi:valyl-tRNA synthetase
MVIGHKIYHMKELEKAYEAKKYEDGIYKKWEASDFFNPDTCAKKNIANSGKYFSMVLPPPNVTGVLHMGHAAMLAIEDVMARYHRMKGDKTLWLPGTDHAAIATQTKVEKLLMEKGMKDPRKELGREKFLEKVDEFAKASHDTIINQCKKMGSSLDWSREAFTLDEKRSLAVRTVFKKMYDDGLIERGYRIVNWCPRCHSTLADDEVEYKPMRTKLYWIKYGPFILATTRPETKLGDTAVAVHPDDERYKDMVGKKYMIPGVLGDFEITVVADEAVDKDFGTGAIKVTPYHSFVDYDIAQRHGVAGKQIIDEDGKMMANCGKYAGMTTEEARRAIVVDMERMGLIDHVDENYENSLSICYRCGTPIEPLPSQQWFIKVNKEFKMGESKIKGIKKGQKTTLKKLMQASVREGQIKIIPEHFDKTYFHWVDNLRDWCISRQIWYGHQIPVWYKGDETYVGVEAPKGDGWTQDPDTLDTWFSSGLWTFSTLGWPEQTADFKDFHPTSVLETGYDILFFWVARMILMTTYTLGDVPFETVYLHGLVRDEQGRKMSKSLGNVIDPLVMTEKYGADATRLSLLIGNTPGNDLKLSEEKIAGFRNFTNKLWNISRFMLLNIENPRKDIAKPIPVTDFDKYILLELDILIASVNYLIENLNFSYSGEILRHFTWSKLADWYLEAAKAEGDKSDILNYILNTILKLWHPFMPFVTETIWQQLYGKNEILMVNQWPESLIVVKNIYKEREETKCVWSYKDGRDTKEPTEISKNISKLTEIIVSIREVRAGANIEPSKKIDVSISAGEYLEFLKRNAELIRGLRTGVDKLVVEKEIKKPENSVVPYVEGAGVYVILGGAIDKEKQKARIEKEIATTEPYIKQLTSKLSNKEFKKNAPPEVFIGEMHKLNEAEDRLEKLKTELNYLKSL